MMPLHQFLEPRFHLLGGRADFQPQRVQGFSLSVADRSSFSAGLLFSAHSFAKQTERISVTAKRPHIRPNRSLAGSHFPGRTMSGEGVLLVSHHRRVAHSGEKIVGLVVLAHVIQTKTPIILLTSAPFGGAVRRFFLAPVPFAVGTTGFRAAILFRFDADTVKEG